MNLSEVQETRTLPKLHTVTIFVLLDMAVSERFEMLGKLPQVGQVSSFRQPENVIGRFAHKSGAQRFEWEKE